MSHNDQHSQIIPPLPYLRRQGSATQLIVADQPFLILGGELHNSSASNLAYVEPIWQRMVALHVNTVLLPIAWEQFEPVEGQYDYTLVDGLLDGARRHGLRLIVLWFGSWKNGASSYVPAWVKRDPTRFPLAQIEAGKVRSILSLLGGDSDIQSGPPYPRQSVAVLSPLAEETCRADATAFAALMRHLRAVDAATQTVLMVQVENEVGLLRDSRDRSELAERAFRAAVDPALTAYLQSQRDQLHPALRERWESRGSLTSGSWAAVFGDDPAGDEIFMAWQYARYLNQVTAAGKAEYRLPMYTNAWLNFSLSIPDMPAGGQHPGEYPSGGPIPHVLDIWQAGAPQIELLAPDIYARDFATWCANYTHAGNPLFIPEMTGDARGARHVFEAIGQYGAFGTSPFAIDDLPASAETPLAQSYAALAQLAPLIVAHQGRGTICGFVLEADRPVATYELGGYRLRISLGMSLSSEGIRKAEAGYGLIMAVGPDAFVAVGSSVVVQFWPLESDGTQASCLAVDEGHYEDGEWIAGRRLNGDETLSGDLWIFPLDRISIQQCVLYRYS